MKITLDGQEAKTHLRSYFQNQYGFEHTEVELSMPVNPDGVDFELLGRAKICARATPDNRIAAIKALRTWGLDHGYGTIGLATSKKLIELFL